MRTYESAVDVTEEQNAKESSKATEEFKVAPVAYTSVPQGLVSTILPAELTGENPVAAETPVQRSTQEVEQSEMNMDIVDADQIVNKYSMQELSAKLEKRLHTKRNYKEDYLHLLNGDFEGVDAITQKDFEQRNKEGKIHLSHKHAPEFFPIAGTVKVIFPELLKIPGIKVGNTKILKRWKNLSDSQKKQVTDIILYNSYISTFIHEIGHNLGLRHNFIGSFDKDNFYTKAERTAQKITGEPAYSSVMDYSFSEFNQLQVLGKYDIAALRFAYARELVTKDNKVVSLDKNDTLKATIDALKSKHGLEANEYLFCTDENAGLSSNCNRFDEGTSLKEIAKHRALRYEQYYKYRNFRDGRTTFNTYGLGGYAVQRHREFGHVRDLLEEYEFFAGLFGKGIMAEGCPGPVAQANPEICGMIKDRIEAVDVAADMLINIVKTPDHICAVALKDNPTTIVAFRKLQDLYDSVKYKINYVPLTCFDAAVKAEVGNENQIVVGENGKYLNGFKDTDPNYKYVSDRAVRGVWIDKALAMNRLFNRRATNGSTDRNHMALVDVPSVFAKVSNVIGHLVTASPLANPTPFKTESGLTFQIPYVVGNDYKVDQLENSLGWLKGFFGMPFSGKSNLTELLLRQVAMAGVNYGEDTTDDAKKVIRLITVAKQYGIIPESFRDNDTRVYYYDKGENYTYHASDENPVALKMISALTGKATLDATDKKIIEKVFKRRTAPEAPEGYTVAEKEFFNMALGDIEFVISNPGLTEEVFVNAFGPERGKLVYSVYATGVEAMTAIQAAKIKIMTVADEGASDAEKELYNLPVQLLADYVAGKITDDMLEYYKTQLEKLYIYK